MLSPQKHLQKILNPTPELKLSIKGEYQLTVRRNGKVIAETPFFSNLVLNSGKEFLGTQSSGSSGVDPIGFCHVGTGTSIPTATQTQLDNYIAGKAANSGLITWSNSGSPNYIVSAPHTYTFNQGAVVGTIGEVGTGWAVNGANLFSRALIKDGLGNPTTLTLTSIDQLTVTFVLSLVRDLTTFSSSITLAGTAYPYSAYFNSANQSGNIYSSVYNGDQTYGLRSYNAGQTQLSFYAAGTPLSPTVLTDSSVPSYTGIYNISSRGYSYTYNSGAYSAKSSMTLNPGDANFSGGIQCFVAYFLFLNFGIQVLFYFSTPIPKTNVHQLVLEFNVSWT